MRDGHREHGTIASVTYDEERGNTFYIGVSLGGSSHQGMGGRHLPGESREACMKEIRAFFGVEDDASLVGRACFVLRNFSEYNESIEGFEVDGRRWTWRDYIRRTFDEDESPLDARLEDIRRDIDFHARRIREQTARLATIADDFVDWSKR